MNLTPAQSKALSTTRHLAILANAGSGKTSVLVTRYVNLFEQFPDLGTRNVAAITFTENAASELRERIMEEVRERLRTCPVDEPARFARLGALRDSLHSAFIGTIHSFAARLLRAYPVEANIDASFAIVTGADERLLREDAIARTCYSALDDAYRLEESKGTENEILHLFRAIGRHAVIKLLHALIDNRRRAERIRKALLEKSDAEVLEFWLEQFENTLSIAAEPKTLDLLREATRYVMPSKDGDSFAASVEAFGRASGFFERMEAFRSMLQTLLTKENTLRKKAIDLSAASESFQQEFHQWLDRVVSIRPLLTCVPKTSDEFQASQTEYLRLMRALFEIFDEVLLEYGSTKAEYGLLDFDDLIERLIALIQDAQVRTEISREFRFLMIDEYQDTDASQFELAAILTENFGSANNLAVVGDPKQAIYTFRNADAEVFSQTVSAITSQTISDLSEAEAVTMALEPMQEQGHIVLDESFRMTKAPLAAINRLFRELFQNASQTYSELIHGRESTIAGRVEWICTPKQIKRTETASTEIASDLEEDNLEEVFLETDLIARKISSIIRNNDYLIEEKGEPRTADYGDIAVLLRSRSYLEQLERSLADHNIPYSVSKGNGFFVQQEILDIVSYLSFLVSPINDIALAAILRSPFFALSDVELFKISHSRSRLDASHKTPVAFWESFQAYAMASSEPDLKNALEQLRENLALTSRTSAAFLVQKIYAETGIIASLQAAPQSEQKIANLEKFLAMARSSDQSGFSGIFDFVERIRYLSDSEEQESQADIPADTGAVRIMTVHAAKGLEFPIVVIPFLQKPFHFTHRNIIDKDLGVQISLPEGHAVPAIAELIRFRSYHDTREEGKRILYVAMTRARDHLIFSCTMPKEPRKDSWLEWICQIFGRPDSSRMSFDETIVRYDSKSQTRFKESFHFDISIICGMSDIPEPVPAMQTPPPPSPYELFLAPLSVRSSASRFSATQLLRFRQCPTKYYLSQLLGMPEEPKLAANWDESDDSSEGMSGTLLGTIVHQLLERFEEFQTGGSIDSPQFQDAVERIFDSIGIATDRTSYTHAARNHLAKFLESPLVPALLTARQTRTEWSLQSMLDSGDTLFGIIDRLYQDKNGTWTVLDYKTDSVPNPNQYEFQIQFYAWLVHRMAPTAGAVRAILFFTATGESVEFAFSDAQLGQIGSEIEAVIAEVSGLDAIHDLRQLPRNRSHCLDCRFFHAASNECIVLAAQNPTAIPAI